PRERGGERLPHEREVVGDEHSGHRCLLCMGRSLRDVCEEGAKALRFFDVNVLAKTLRELARSAASFAVGRAPGHEQSRVRHPTSMRGHLVNAESDFGPRQARRRIRVLIAVLAGATLLALAT